MAKRQYRNRIEPLPVHSLPEGELSLDKQVGQLFMPAVFINDTEAEVRQMERLISEHCIGALCFFHSRASAATNFEGKGKIVHNENSFSRLKELIARYQGAAEIPLLIAMDAEWGLAMRIENTPQYPYAITLGALEGEALVQAVGRNIGLDCQGAGIHWNLAPVVDINNNPENPVIGYRSFGDDPQGVLAKSRAFVLGMASAGTLHAIKHFPGHGDTATDSHLGLPIIDRSLEQLAENELFPFQGHIKTGVDAVMVGHLSLPRLDPHQPATTSHAIITGLLRRRMGFEGVVISDALNMHAVSKNHPEKGELEAKAFAAGMDMLCFSEHPREGIHAILGSSDAQRIKESFQRVWRLKKKAFAAPGPENLDRWPAPSLQRKIAQGCLTEHYGEPALVPRIKERGFHNLSLDNARENIFSKALEREYGHRAVDLGSDPRGTRALMEGDRDIVLALFPPGVKPKDHFGIPKGKLGAIRELLAQKRVLVYLFGNPYVLDILGLRASSNVVLAYQDFPEFQEVALDHFRGEHRAVGRLPVRLKSFDL